MKKKFVICGCLIPLAACAPEVMSSEQVHADGNQLIVQDMLTPNGGKSVHIKKNTIEWVGRYAGGEEAVPERKELMKHLSAKQAAQKCSPNPSVADSDIDYVMMDKDPMVYGGGLLGYAMAAAKSDYKNLPMASWYHYSCEGEEGPSSAKPAKQR